jgi:myo-inositol-1(or 4)-monophosphatase
VSGAHEAASREALAAVALAAAEEAAALVAKGYRSRPVVDKKGRADLVTEFDRASEALLYERLPELSPGIPVVGEEHTGSGETEHRRGLVWYVDPLDGTTNFVHGHPFWCVSVGLMEDDRPIAGAIVAPSLSLRWVGWVDPGGARTATRNGEPCSVSATSELGEALIATGFPPNRRDPPHDNFGSFVAVKRAAQAVRRCGSAAIDLAMVADGTFDAYWERRLHAWDTTAGGAIVLAAGGKVTALDGGVPDYHVGRIVASNGLLHEKVVEVLKRPDLSSEMSG